MARSRSPGSRSPDLEVIINVDGKQWFHCCIPMTQAHAKAAAKVVKAEVLRAKREFDYYAKKARASKKVVDANSVPVDTV